MEALPRQTAGEKERRRKVMAIQLCSVVGPAATKLGYVYKTGAVYW